MQQESNPRRLCRLEHAVKRIGIDRHVNVPIVRTRDVVAGFKLSHRKIPARANVGIKFLHYRQILAMPTRAVTMRRRHKPVGKLATGFNRRLAAIALVGPQPGKRDVVAIHLFDQVLKRNLSTPVVFHIDDWQSRPALQASNCFTVGRDQGLASFQRVRRKLPRGAGKGSQRREQERPGKSGSTFDQDSSGESKVRVHNRLLLASSDCPAGDRSCPSLRGLYACPCLPLAFVAGAFAAAVSG